MVDEKREEILQMLGAGMSLRAIAEEMGLTPTAVAKIRDEAQGGAKPSATKVDRDDKVAEAYEAGWPIKRILSEYSIGRTQLYAILAKFEIPTRKVTRDDARERAMDEAISLYKQGVVIRKITADTGIHQPTLHAEIAKRGIPMRRPRNNVKRS